MEMPILKPIPIKTRDCSFFTRVARWITSVRKWEVVEDWSFKLPGDDTPTIVVPRGFVFDGASIPRALWGLLSPTGLLLIPGLIHDFAYRYDYLWARNEDGSGYLKYGEGKGQKYWDELFKQVGLQVNGMVVIDRLAWLALWAGGKAAWKKNRARNEPELQPSLIQTGSNQTHTRQIASETEEQVEEPA